MDCNHIINKKVRLLFNEFGGDGYYIWSCLLDYGYGKWGYLFDLNDKDELELFSTEFCKMKLNLVTEVISGCLRRGLFNKTVYDVSKILTSVMMQETFIVATSERRQKGTKFEMRSDWLLLDFTEDIPRNILIVPPKNQILPPKKAIVPPNNPHIREEENRGEKILAPSAQRAPVNFDFSEKKNNNQARESVRPGAKKQFIPPTKEQARRFFVEAIGDPRKPNAWPEDKCFNEAHQFVDFYTANGWVQGRGDKKVQDWESAARLWIRNDLKGSFKSATPQATQLAKSAPSPPKQILPIENDINYVYESFLEGRITEAGQLEQSHCNYMKSVGALSVPTTDALLELFERLKADGYQILFTINS
jgi:hypothetical protein